MIMDNSCLLKKINDGDNDAFEKMVSDNMGLVNNIVNDFCGRGYEREDLVQIGAIGLIKAIRKFDINYGVQFSTYAVPVIAGEIRRFFRDDGIIKVSRTVKMTAAKGRTAENALRQRTGREPTVSEISDECGIGTEELVYAFEACRTCESLNEYIMDTENEKEDILPVESYEEKVVEKIWIKDSLNSLLPRERQVIVLRYIKDMTQSKIAEIIGVSQVHVSRIEKKALDKIKLMLSENN